MYLHLYSCTSVFYRVSGMGSSSNSAKSDTADAKSFKINLFPDSGGFMKSDGSKGNDDENSNYIMIDIDGTADSKTFDRYMEEYVEVHVRIQQV